MSSSLTRPPRARFRTRTWPFILEMASAQIGIELLLRITVGQRVRELLVCFQQRITTNHLYRIYSLLHIRQRTKRGYGGTDIEPVAQEARFLQIVTQSYGRRESIVSMVFVAFLEPGTRHALIIGLDNKKVSNMADLQEAIAKHRPGDKVKVKLIRDKKEKTVEVTLKNEQGTTKIVKDAGMEILGAAFKELPDDLKKQLNLGYGLQVTGVSSGKMSDAGVRKGFIILKANDQPMRKVSDLEEVMKAAV